MATLRSREWFQAEGVYGFIRRAWVKAEGFLGDNLDRPIIGVCNSWSEFNHCNRNLREVAEAVKRGVWQAGGFPLEFDTISLGETMMKPTTMLYRNLMSMDVEEMIRANPMDGVVLLCSCDKTTPAQLMGAASVNLPALMVTGGPMLNGRWRGRDLGACTDCRLFTEELRAGRLTEEEYHELENCVIRSTGHCMVMGTASTMASIAEALGMTLPGCAAIPAPDSRRLRLAEASGRQIVEVVQQNIRPSDIITRKSLENAIRVSMAVGGSTNAVIHLVAIAGRLGVDLPLSLFDDLSRTTPWIANLRPSGRYQMEELFEAGGIPAVMKELSPLLHLDCLTVTGKTIAENIATAEVTDREVIAPLAQPLHPEGGTVILSGNLCPKGAVIKQTAASPHLLQHTGRAVVFENYADMMARVDDPHLEVDENSVLVCKNLGPRGAPGMPEWGHLPIPKKLLAKGVKDLVRLSDARMSGTAYGTVVLHVAPESAVGGPLAVVQSGDQIQLDAPNRQLNLLLPDGEIQRRLARWQPPQPHFQRGYGWLYINHVTQADEGVDFDFLRLTGAARK